jgi:hypothetical protein
MQPVPAACWRHGWSITSSTDGRPWRAFCNLQELLSQVGHYSERTRTAAVAGLADLLGRHPQQATKNTGPLLEALAPRISDADAGVRKALLQLLNAQVTSASICLCSGTCSRSRGALARKQYERCCRCCRSLGPGGCGPSCSWSWRTSAAR